MQYSSRDCTRTHTYIFDVYFNASDSNGKLLSFFPCACGCMCVRDCSCTRFDEMHASAEPLNTLRKSLTTMLL